MSANSCQEAKLSPPLQILAVNVNIDVMGKKIFFILGLLFLLVALGVGLFVVQQRQELRQKAAPATTIAFSPSQVTKNVGEEFSLDVVVDTGPNAVQQVIVELTYDPQKLEALSFTNTPTFPNIISKEEFGNGKARIGVTTVSVPQPFTGVGTVAKIRFKTLSPTDTPITIAFTDETFVGSLAEGQQNALIGKDNARITITGGSGGTPTPTPGPSPTPSRTPPPSPTPTPGPLSLTITSPQNGAAVANTKPTASGKAKAGTAVTVTFLPSSVTGAVNTDASGNWTFTPQQALNAGAYTLSVTASDPLTGATQNSTIAFTISSGSPAASPTPPTGGTPTPTPPVPVTGGAGTTVVLIMIGMLLLSIGVILPFII